MKAILTAVIAMLVSVGTAQTVVSNNVLTKRICYVKKDAKGSNNGENWQDALTELSTALDFAKAHQKEFTEKEPLQIWVAGSANYSYSPKVGDGITADKATFAMVKNVKIYGGFAGNETALLQRNWYANPTILSGRVNNAGVAHIGRLITSEGAMGVATLDGFRLKYAAPINGKKGVAIYVANGSPRFENCAITDNLFGSEALIYVKGTERERATPIFINLQVSDNTPKKEDIIGDNVDDNIDQPNNGADGLVMTPWAMENDQYADTQLINATFYNNGSNDLKVARSASPKIYNTVLLERVDGNFKNIDVQYSMVNGALSGNGNIPVESPAGIFVSLSKDDKHYLRPKRSLINAGNGGLYHSKSDNDFDLAHMPRIMEETIDIGAYEFYKDYESICNEIPRPNIEPNYYGNSCDGGGVNVRLSNYTDYHKINERGATYKVYDIEGKEVRPYMEPLIESYSGRIHINQEGRFKLVVSYKGCEKESDWFQIYYSRGAGKPNSPSLKTYPATCDSNSWVEIQNYESKYRYELLKDNRVINIIKNKDLVGLQEGSYELKVYNDSGCDKSSSFRIEGREKLDAPIVEPLPAECGKKGKGYITQFEQKWTYQLLLNGKVLRKLNSAEFTADAGSYQVVVRNTNGCVATSTTFVIEEAKKIPQKPDVWVDAPACGVSGKAIIKNYDRNLTYKLNNGASTKLLGSAEINEAGEYTLLVYNGSCDSEEVHFTVAAAKENVTAPKVTTTSATCGEIGKAYIEGYDSNLRYRLVALSATGAAVKSSAINTANLSMTAGTYQVVVRNANGCVATSTTFVIEEAKKIPALPKIDFITEAGCGIANDIRIRDYDKDFSYTLISKSGVRKSINSLHIEATEGTYQLEVSNGDCAVTTSEFHIGKEKVLPAKPELRVLPATCGGVTDVLIKNYDNSLNYELSPAIAGNEILSNGVISATANNYVLIVSNGSCTSQSDPFEIKAQLLPPAVPTIEEEVAATCAAPSLVRISNYDPALQYKLSPAGEILQGGVISATVGRYIVIATNNNGCSANSSIFVINPQKEAPAQPKITVYNASCGTKGGAVIRNYRGDYTYSFTPEATITAGGVISATAGKYQLKVSNGSCEATVSFEIEAERAIPAQPTVIVTAPDCGVAGSARISNYDPQLSYTVLPKIEGNVVLDNGVISVTAGGSYNVVVSNGYCKKSSEPFVVQRANEIPATPIVVTTSATCGEIGKAYIANYDRRYTDKYVLTPSGRVHYDGTIIADAGNYVLSVNNGSCKVSTAFTIEAEEAMPKAPAIVTTPATCGEAGSAKITNYDSNFTYTLLEGNKSTVLDNAVISVGEGVYRVSVTNAAGCQLISREFSIQAAKVISEKPVVITQAAICGEEGSAYVANYNPIYQYTVFPNGSVDANGNIKASKNIFTYVTAHYKGCSATSEGFTIQPKLNGVEQPEILLIPGGCGAVGFARITNFNPDYEYEVLPTGTITPDGRVMAPPTNTYYRVRAFHNGCAATSENFRLQPSTSGFEKPVLSVAKENCNMGTIAFVKNYNKEFTYTVHPFGGVTKDTGILVFPENSVTHTFSVTVTASNGVCQSTSDAVLIIPERSYQPRVAIVARTCDSEGAAYITNYNPAYRYVFTDPLLSVTDAGVILGAQPELVYAVAARTPDDCSSKETVFSIRNECENEVPCKIEIFNAVSANNDDANDFFYIKNIECYPSNKVYIFNSQGKVVFEQQNYDNSHRSFRGISNTEGAQLLPSGTYFYILKYADKRGRETDERGYLYLKGRY